MRQTNTPPLAHAASPEVFMARYLRKRLTLSAALASAILIAAVCAVAAQYAMKLLIDALADPNRRTALVWPHLGFFLGLIAAESLLLRVAGVLVCRVTVGMGVEIRVDLARTIAQRPLDFFTHNLMGALGQRITGTAGSAGAFVNTVVWRIVPPVVDFLGALTIFLFIDWEMGLAAAAFVAVAASTLIVVGIRGRPLHVGYFSKAVNVAGNLVDFIANIWAVNAFAARDREVQRLATECLDEAVSQRRSWMYTERVRFAYDVVLWLMAATMLTWAIWGWEALRLTAGDVVVVSAMTFRLLHGSRDVALAVVEAGQQRAYLSQTLMLLDESSRPPRYALAPPCVPGDLVFNEVSFGFDGQPLLFRHLHLHIGMGERVGIVGPSGSGKTTLLQLIQRQYEIQSGTITIAGQMLEREESSRLLAVVPQEVSLFHRTIVENIRLGKPDAPLSDVIAAARTACCDEFVANLPQGLESMVGERGLKLSGGQRQRVGIARAILRDAPFLLLDEATSALDTETELAIQRNLMRFARTKTLITVAHRLSTLAEFPRILVLEAGEIVGDGTAQHLRSHNAWFRRMWDLQAGGLAATSPSVDVLERVLPVEERAT